MEKLEENIKIRVITGGCFHRRSLVFHIEYDGRYLQYTLNHINAKTINVFGYRARFQSKFWNYRALILEKTVFRCQPMALKPLIVV